MKTAGYYHRKQSLRHSVGEIVNQGTVTVCRNSKNFQICPDHHQFQKQIYNPPDVKQGISRLNGEFLFCSNC